MAPPELTRDAPVLDVVHPLVVGVDPVFWNEGDLSCLDSIDGFLRDAFAGGVLVADFIHGHEPLVGEHRFHNLSGARASWDHEFVFFDVNHQPQCFEVFDDLFACGKSI